MHMLLKRCALLAILAAGFGILPARANNIVISNPVLTNQNSGTKTAEIQFDLSWENSWRLTNGPANWDAAWVLVKFHTGDGVWRHAYLSTNDSDHTAPAGATIRTGSTSTNGMGVFIYRNAEGSGNVSFPGARLKWRYGDNAVADAALVSVDVTAIEMVYVPEGSFYLGDGTSNGWGYAQGIDSTNDPAFLVTGPGPLDVGFLPGQLAKGEQGPSLTVYSNIPASYPNGYRAFYCMKYHVTQGQHADAANKDPNITMNNSVSRRPVTGSEPNLVAVTPDRASSGFALGTDWYYLDWAALRPMTDMEYEKACRGPLPPVRGEYAWGTAVAASLSYGLVNDGTATESVGTNYNENAGNAWLTATVFTNIGPCRVGMFAKASYNGTTSARIQSGATYYGIMNMSDNDAIHALAPRLFNADTTSGFDGAHGDGITASSIWPPGWSTLNGTYVRRVGMRWDSGGWGISRHNNSTSATGCRGARTAPAP